MNVRLSRFVLCGGLVAAMGCQSTFDRSTRFAESLETRFSVASDDDAGLETGRGHSPSLASELADRRHEAGDTRSPKKPGESVASLERLLERGNDADADGRSQEAKMYYQQVLAEDANHPEAHHRLAILADRAGDYASAEMHYQQALRAEPGNADVLNDLGYSCFLQGRAADSERYLNQALKIKPRHPHVQENLSLLYDREKAERVLMTVMGPRQTQATLAWLFENVPAATPNPIAHLPADAPASPQRASIQATDVTPVEALQQKMAEARQQSIADRERRNASVPPALAAEPRANLPQLPANYPAPAPPQAGYGTASHIPDGRINDAFRAIDNSRSVQNGPGGTMANQLTEAPLQNDRPIAAVGGQTDFRDERPAAPQWNTPPVAWPDYPQADESPRQTIQQASYSEPAGPPPSDRSSIPSAAERAAEIGMATGPGAIFPTIEDSFAEAPVSAPPSVPDARFTGMVTPQPSGQQHPAPWDNAVLEQQQQPSSASWNQLPVGGDSQQPPQPEVFADQFRADPAFPQSRAGTNAQPSGFPQEAYDQIRAAHNAQVSQDPQAFSRNPDLKTNSPPAAETMPPSWNPQSAPASHHSSSESRLQEMPIITPQPRTASPANVAGQSVPPYNPGTQQSPQNYGNTW